MRTEWNKIVMAADIHSRFRIPIFALLGLLTQTLFEQV